MLLLFKKNGCKTKYRAVTGKKQFFLDNRNVSFVLIGKSREKVQPKS